MIRHPVVGLTEGLKLPAPVLVFAATDPFSQHLATTADGGRTWQRFAGNPVVANMGEKDRDPKVIWHEASEHYVMVLFVGSPESYRILRSKDLITWEQVSVLPNWYECPEFFPVKSPTTGEDLWVLYGCYRNKDEANGPVFTSTSCYQLGRFDGADLHPGLASARRTPWPQFLRCSDLCQRTPGPRRHDGLGALQPIPR